jgi:hypothetical protein
VVFFPVGTVTHSPVQSAILSKNYSVWIGVACGSPAEFINLSSPPAQVKDSRSVGDMNKSGGRQHMVLMTAIPVGFSSD